MIIVIVIIIAIGKVGAAVAEVGRDVAGRHRNSS